MEDFYREPERELNAAFKRKSEHGYVYLVYQNNNLNSITCTDFVGFATHFSETTEIATTFFATEQS